MMPTPTKILAWLATSCYIGACALPAYSFDNNDEIMPGVGALLLGWIEGLTAPLIFFAWVSNVFFIIALFMAFLSKKRKRPLYFAFIAFILMWGELSIHDLLLNEGGTRGDVTLSIGGYLWYASYLTLLVAMLVEQSLTKKSEA